LLPSRPKTKFFGPAVPLAIANIYRYIIVLAEVPGVARGFFIQKKKLIKKSIFEEKHVDFLAYVTPRAPLCFLNKF